MDRSAEPARQARPRVLWLQAGGCGGCTMSLLGGDDGADLFTRVERLGLDWLGHPAWSLASGEQALAVLEAAADGSQPPDILCIEGAMLRGPHGSGHAHRVAGSGVPMTAWVQRIAPRARHVVAVGSCAAFGGIVAAGANPAEACGLVFDGAHAGGLLGADFRAGAGLPVINVAGCPSHAGWVLDTLALLVRDELQPADLDAFHRPRLYADQLVHHGCARNEYYEFKASAEQPSQLGCLMEHLGCKGTQAHADCNLRLWNGSGSCTRGGHACIACTEPGFEEPGHPFARTPKLGGIPIGLPTDMPKAWFVALAALSKSATPARVRDNARADHLVTPPRTRRSGKKDAS